MLVFEEHETFDKSGDTVNEIDFAHARTVREPMRLASINASASLRLIRTRRPNFTNGILRWHTQARIVLGLSRSKAAAPGTVRSSLSIPHLSIFQPSLDCRHRNAP